VLGTVTFAQVVLVVWLLSSVSEELLTRGWLQGVLNRWRDRRAFSIAVPALISGGVFGAMHLSLYFKGIDATTATVVVVFATLLGVWAGILRNRFGSLLPPVIAHITFNVGAAIGAVIFVVAYRVTTGHLPPQLLK
jgi:membrane protease YdiL (CAAX protease family)